MLWQMWQNEMKASELESGGWGAVYPAMPIVGRNMSYADAKVFVAGIKSVLPARMSEAEMAALDT